MTTSDCDRSYTVLLVEDNAAQAALTRYALAEARDVSFRLEHVTSVAEATRRLAGSGIDVALIDLSLPDSSGLETFQAIRAAAAAVPVVVLTGWDDEQLAVELLKHGAQDYLVKDDVQPKLLIRSLRFAIERQRVQTLESLNEQLEETKSSLTHTVDRLEQANEDLAQFTCFFSHDLQEPLRKLVFYSNQLDEAMRGQINEQAEQDLKCIADAARRMQSLVQALLMLSRARQATLEWSTVDLQECAQQTLNCLVARIEETGAEIACDVLPVVTGDATLLTLVYQNLIGNALKFVDGVRPVIRLTAEQQGESWLLGVHDNGIGIQPESIQQVFVPFKRSCRRGAYEGTGVGLAVCKKVIERHGGRIWVESTPGNGAQFHFVLPMQQARDLDSAVKSKRREAFLCSN